MKLNRKRSKLIKASHVEDSFVEGTPQELISYIWDITADLYSLMGSEYVERRLQRNITNFIKK